ncbi:MAG: M14 family metallopeptidase [Oscillospiraceae bacterium]|nr:M14 family metallopeptidase [Oscillospiraceae bacterium]
MKEEVLFTIDTLYRPELEVKGFRFGAGKKALCVVGSTRGNEIQQTYVCALLVKTLKSLEQMNALRPGFEVLVIPTVNQNSINVGRRFWPLDNSDINRMFPGYDKGETTQRIAADLFELVKDFESGVQLASFSLLGDFLPHVRVMHTGYQRTDLAAQFGMAYIVDRTPEPVDSTTLNYNWQIWGTNAFSLYTKETDRIDDESAHEAVMAILRFMNRQGWLRYPVHSGYLSSTIRDEDMVSVLIPTGGIFHRFRNPGDLVRAGEPMAEILSPYDASPLGQVISPVSGTVFFAHRGPLVIEHEVAFDVIRQDRMTMVMV